MKEELGLTAPDYETMIKRQPQRTCMGCNEKKDKTITIIR